MWQVEHLRLATAPYGAAQPSACDNVISNLWDSIWFGLGSCDSSSSSSTVSRSKRSYTADPLDNVIPVVDYDYLYPGLQPNGFAVPGSLQGPLQLPQQQAAAGGAAPLNQQQQHTQQGLMPLTTVGQSHAGKVAPLAKPGPTQPRPMWVPSLGGAAASAAASRAAAYAVSPTPSPELLQQQQQQQQQQDQQSHAQQQEPDVPAPFVLGTWAQRQYILPVQRPSNHANGVTGLPASPAAEQQPAESAPRGNASPARLIPRGKAPSSNNSSGSSGASVRSKAAPSAAHHSSSGTSSEAPLPAGTKQATAEAAAAAAVADAERDTGAAANGGDAVAAAVWQQQPAVEVLSGRRSLGTDDEEEAVQQIAWRWRFARRWQAEQARGPGDPAAAAASPGDGGMEEALQYLAACGENWHHLSRESSRLGTMDSRLLGTLGSLGCLGSELLADESFSAMGSAYGMQASLLLQDTADSGGALAASCNSSREVSMTGDSSNDGAPGQQQQAAGVQQAAPGLQQQLQEQAQQQRRRRQRAGQQPRGEATVQVTGITKKAQELLEAQRDISRLAQERWQQVSSKQGSTLWVGALLEGVQVDPWGKFKFLLLRVKDRNGRQVLLVRGANNASESKLVEDLHKQVLAACSAHDLPTESIEVMGGGIMEWTQHRDRHLHISGGYASRGGAGGGPSNGTEVMRLAAVLTQQALPMHYKVTSDGDKTQQH